MNNLLLCFAAINLFFSMHAMDCPPQTTSIWVTTADDLPIEIDEIIAQQSNLLTVLQAEGLGKQHNPIKIGIDKEDLDFFCSSITTSAQQLLTKLSDEDYSALMDITEELKCLIFYSELMEQLIAKDASHLIAKKSCLPLLNKMLCKHFTQHITEQKKCIKTSKLNQNREIPGFICSSDGKYFLENISTSGNAQMNLWTTNPLKQIKTFPGYTHAQFSPGSNFIILYSQADCNPQPMKIPPLFYSIEHNAQGFLIENYSIYSGYNAIFHANNQTFIQKLRIDYDNSLYILMHYSSDENKLKKIEYDFPQKTDKTIFLWDDKNILCVNNSKRELIHCKIDSDSQQIIDHNCIAPNFIPITQSFTENDSKSASTLLLASRKNIKTLCIEKNPRNEDELLFKIAMLTPSRDIDLKIQLTTVNTQKNICAYATEEGRLQIIDFAGNEIAYHNTLAFIFKIVFDVTGNYLVSLCNKYNDPFLIFWDLSQIPFHIQGIKVHPKSYISDIQFTDDGLLLTHGNRPSLWNMNGDKIITLDKDQNPNENRPSCLLLGNSLLTIKKIQEHIHNRQSSRLIKQKIRLFSAQNIKKAMSDSQDIRKSLLLSQAFLLNESSTHKTIYPNMPDGRALTSLKPEHVFLTKNLELAQHNFIPKNPPTSQPGKPLLEQS